MRALASKQHAGIGLPAMWYNKAQHNDNAQRALAGTFNGALMPQVRRYQAVILMHALKCFMRRLRFADLPLAAPGLSM